MSDTPKTLEPSHSGEAKLTFIPAAADIPRVYCNNAQISASQWDVTFLLGQIEQQFGADSRVVGAQVVPRVVVTMSHLHAKAFLDALRRTMESYERAAQAAQQDASSARHS